MYRPVAAVGEQLRHKDVIPVGSSGRIREGLAPAAALAVHLVVGSLHGVYQFQIPSKQAHEAVDGQLGVVLLALRPVLLHALQDQLQAALVDVRRCVQAPLEVLPLGQPRLIQQVGTDGLGVPPFADEWQPVQHALAVVAGHLHPHEIGQLALLRGNDAVQGTEDGQREASVGQAVLSAAAHVDALAGAVEIPLLQLEDQRWKPGGCGVVLVDVATKAALQGGAFQARLGSMTLQAQGLQLLLLSGEGLGHRDDVIDLEGSESDGRAAEFAHPLLPSQQLLPPPPGVLALAV